MRSSRVILFLLVFCVACKPAPKQAAPAAPAPQGPTVRATVVTIKITTQPGDKTATHELLIAPDGRARGMDEIDVWRIFDTKANRVTFIDTIAQTYRTADVPALAKARHTALAGALPAQVPRASFTVTKTKKALPLGVQATQSLVKVGGYTREVWIGSHPAIPRGLYAAMVAAREPSSDIEPMARAVDEALMQVDGFPLAEHSELPLGNQKLTVDREVVSVGARDVPATLFEVPKGYKKLPS